MQSAAQCEKHLPKKTGSHNCSYASAKCFCKGSTVLCKLIIVLWVVLFKSQACSTHVEETLVSMCPQPIPRVLCRGCKGSPFSTLWQLSDSNEFLAFAVSSEKDLYLDLYFASKYTKYCRCSTLMDKVPICQLL